MAVAAAERRLDVAAIRAEFPILGRPLDDGTPVDVARSQPWDQTIGKSLPTLDDSALPNPPMPYLLSPQVFRDAEQGKMWQF